MKNPDILAQVRTEHNARYMELKFGKYYSDIEQVPSYFSGWKEISAFVNAAFKLKYEGRTYVRCSRIKEEDYEDAIALAKKLSDLYFEYAPHE